MSIAFSQLPKGIIFDCDGVIIDSFDANTYFYNILRKSVGLPDMTEAQRQEAHQLTGAQALELVIPTPLREAAQQAYHNINYVRDIVPMLPINKGLHELLAYCKAQGIFTGIHTNRIIGMQEILDTNNLSEYYNPVMTPAELPAKPDPIGSLEICKQWGIKVEEALFVGDSENDQKTATAACIPFVAFKNPKLNAPNHAEDFIDIENWLKSL